MFNLVDYWKDSPYALMIRSSTDMPKISIGLAMFVDQRTIEYGSTLAAALTSMTPLLIIYLI